MAENENLVQNNVNKKNLELLAEVTPRSYSSPLVPTDIQQAMKPLDVDLYSQILQSPLFQDVRKSREGKPLSQPELNVLMAAVISAQKREQTLVSLLNRSFYSTLLSVRDGILRGARKPLFYSPSLSDGNAGNANSSPEDSDKQKKSSFWERINNIINLQNITILIAVALMGFGAYQKVQKEELNSTINILKGSVQAQKDAKKTYEKKIKELKELNEKNKAKINEEQIKMAELSFALEKETEKLRLTEEKNKELIKEKEESLKKTEAQAEGTAAALKTQITNLKTEKGKLEKKLDSTRKQLSDYKVSSKKWEERATNRKRSLKARTDELKKERASREDLYDKYTVAQRYESAYALSRRAFQDIEEILPGWSAWGNVKEFDEIRKRIKLLHGQLDGVINVND